MVHGTIIQLEGKLEGHVGNQRGGDCGEKERNLRFCELFGSQATEKFEMGV